MKKRAVALAAALAVGAMSVVGFSTPAMAQGYDVAKAIIEVAQYSGITINPGPEDQGWVYSGVDEPGKLKVIATKQEQGSDLAEVDFAATGASNRWIMQRFGFWVEKFAPSLTALIHTTPFGDDNGFYVKDGQRHNYGSAANDYATRVHVVMTRANAETLLRKLKMVYPTIEPITAMFGLDYAFDRPCIEGMKAEGVCFASRYLSKVNHLTQPKLLTKNEAIELSQAGIAVVSNYEWYEDRCIEGFDAGVEDAKIAAEQAEAAGMPADRPIYFSVDKDLAPEQVVDYFMGVVSVMGKERTGVYGSFRIVKALRDMNLASWTWQTFAWSGNQWDPRNNFEQYHNNRNLGGASVDYDRALTPDYGQWFSVHAGVGQPAGVGVK